MITSQRNPITCIRFSPNGKLFASGDSKGVVTIYENDDDFYVRKSFENIVGGPVKDIAFTEDNERLLVVGECKGSNAKAILINTGTSVGEIAGAIKNLITCDLKPNR